MSRLTSAVTSFLLIVSLIACGGSGAGGTPPPGGPGVPPPPGGPGANTVEPYVLKGHVTDTQGRPLAGANVVAGFTLGYDNNLLALTDENGNYRIEMPAVAGTWRVDAGYDVNFEGQRFEYELYPSSTAPFGAATGAIRNFQWRLTGEKPGSPAGRMYGGKITVSAALGYDPAVNMDSVAVWLMPSKLVDGTTPGEEAELIVAGEDPDVIVIRDVAIGTYQAVAFYIVDLENGVLEPLDISVRNANTYGDSATGSFVAHSNSDWRLEFEVRWPPTP